MVRKYKQSLIILNLLLKPEGFFMPVKPQATAKVYYSLFELKRNEVLLPENFNPCLSL
jgi:hypothetical protein